MRDRGTSFAAQCAALTAFGRLALALSAAPVALLAPLAPPVAAAPWTLHNTRAACTDETIAAAGSAFLRALS